MDRTKSPNSPGLRLWGRLSSCNVQKAVWTLEELGLDYERIDVGGDFGGLDRPDYLALNPHGRIPTLVDGAVVVWESEAILRYLAARYGVGRLWDDDPAKRAVADQWMAWTAASLYPDWIRLFWKLVRMPPSRRDPKAIERHRRATVGHYQALDRHLAGQRYIAGDDFSMADIPAGTTLHRWFEMEIERPSMPHLEAWYDRLRTRSAYRTAVCVSFDDLVGKESY